VTLSARHAAALRKVEAARIAARILRPQSAYIDPTWEPSRETTAIALEIVRRATPQIAEEKASEFCSALYWAVVDLKVARASGSATIKDAIARLAAVSEAARALADAWTNASQLRDAMRIHFSGRFTTGQNVNVIREGAAFADRAEQFMSDEAWRVVGELGPLSKALSTCTARNSPFRHAFVWALAAAWRDATGSPPTWTGNKRETRKGMRSEAERYATPFQELIRLVTPASSHGEAPLGDAIVREVVEVFGAKGREKSTE
jgi:hypothetical protein